jgi:hypothetical protein
MTALIKHGMLLQSAHGPLPNVAEMIAGEPMRCPELLGLEIH